MASSGKKKTTMAKLSRESRLRERRLDKKAKKDARKLASAQQPGQPNDTLTGDDQGVDGSGVGQADPDAVVEALGEN